MKRLSHAEHVVISEALHQLNAQLSAYRQHVQGAPAVANALDDLRTAIKSHHLRRYRAAKARGDLKAMIYHLSLAKSVVARPEGKRLDRRILFNLRYKS